MYIIFTNGFPHLLSNDEENFLTLSSPLINLQKSHPALWQASLKASTLDAIFSSIFRFCITKPPKKLYFNRPYVKKSQNDGIAILDFRLIT